jgi:tetratricopeptide (TPR) repeat protein
MNGIRVSLFVLLASVCYAEKLPILRGRVEGGSAFIGNEYTVELKSQGGGPLPFQSSVSSDGSFEFRNVPTGAYQLRLSSFRGGIISEQMVDLTGYSTELSIPMPNLGHERPVSGTVSVRDLQRKIPAKAVRAFSEAERERSSGHDLEAVRKLQKALQADPNYWDARCNLGVEFIHLKRYPEALEQFEKAVAGGPPSPILYGNLAYSLIAVGRPQDAEQAARHAISLDDSYARGHYLLGNILMKRVTPASLAAAPEAALELRKGASEMPHGHIMIAQLYLIEGDKGSAVEELRLYLKSDHRQFREGVERWLQDLTRR